MAGVLEGIRVLDLSWGIAGPMSDDAAGRSRRAGDEDRAPGRGSVPCPARLRGLEPRQAQRGSRSETACRTRSASSRSPACRRSRRELRPGRHGALGIDYETLAKANPRLIYCSITGLRPRQQPLGAPGLRCPGRGARRAALGAARLARGRDQPDGRARGPVRRRRDPDEWLQGAAAARAAVPGLVLAEPGRLLRRVHRHQRGAARARDHRTRPMGRRPRSCRAPSPAPAACGSAPRRSTHRCSTAGSSGSRSPKGHFECADGRWIHNWVPNPRFLLTASAGDKLNADPGSARRSNDPDRFGTGPRSCWS